MKNFISKYDSQNQLKVLTESYKQIEDAWNNKFDISKTSSEKIDGILLCGLGGSAVSGDLLKDFLSEDLKIPFYVHRNYNLPSYVNENWLVIISSYSGNTEETISCFEQALRLKTRILTISSGGKVEQIAVKNSIPHIKIKSGFQPRFALGLSFFTILKVLQGLNLIGNQDENVKIISNLWKKKGEYYSQQKNFALEIAGKLIGYIPLIYSSEMLAAAGYRFKCQLNENSKVHSFHHIIPEMNHNEIIGWESHKQKQFNTKIILLFDDSYHPQIKKRYFVFAELAASRGVEIVNLASSEKNYQVRIMDLIYLCDWISFYLAVMRGFDPSEIDFIHEMKKRLV